MSFSIDTAKVQASIRAIQPLYLVASCNIPLPAPHDVQVLDVSVVSTVLAVPPGLERARTRLLALRQQLLESGQKPFSSSGLDRELDETRGRV